MAGRATYHARLRRPARADAAQWATLTGRDGPPLAQPRAARCARRERNSSIRKAIETLRPAPRAARVGGCDRVRIACAAPGQPALGSRPAPSSTALAERHVRPFARSRIVNARGGGGPDDRRNAGCNGLSPCSELGRRQRQHSRDCVHRGRPVGAGLAGWRRAMRAPSRSTPR
jgi:hypothetical protein